MAHLTRTIADTKLVRGYVTTAADMSAIDQKTFVAINGDEGGSWTPTDPIEIGGAGIVVAGPWTMTGAGVNVTTGVSKPIIFDRGTTGDYFGIPASHSLSAPITRNGFFDYLAAVPSSVAWFGGLITRMTGARFHTPLSVYSGAPSITTVEVSWRVREAHANVPQYLPRMRVIAVSDDGVAIPLRSKDATTDADGFQTLPKPASGAAYYNGGVAQTWTYTCNVVLPVDSAKYAYYVEFIDEYGTGSWVTDGNQFYGAITAHDVTSIFNGRN